MLANPTPTPPSNPPVKPAMGIWYSAAPFAVLLIVIALIAYALSANEGRFLLQLQEVGVARGLITFLVSIATIAIGLTLAIYVMASNADDESLKHRFSFAKDVLATLVGIFGTVLGFYFGSSTVQQSPSIADIQLRGQQLVTHVSGGFPPYQVVVRAQSEDAAKAVPTVSKDGWIFAEIPKAITKAGEVIVIEVADAKGVKLSRTFAFPEGAAVRDGAKGPTTKNPGTESPAGSRPVVTDPPSTVTK